MKEKTLIEEREIYWQDSGDEGEEFYTHEGFCFKEKDVKEASFEVEGRIT